MLDERPELPVVEERPERRHLLALRALDHRPANVAIADPRLPRCVGHVGDTELRPGQSIAPAVAGVAAGAGRLEERSPVELTSGAALAGDDDPRSGEQQNTHSDIVTKNPNCGMFAVSDMTKMMIRHIELLAGSLSLFLVACGGASPAHDGYPASNDEPWVEAKKLKLNDNFEASTEGSVSFPTRQRAQWYVVDLPAPGSVVARVTMDPLTTGADVGVEVLDSGYNILVPAEDDNDIGQDKKERKVPDARAGKLYVHVFTLGREDRADYRLRVKYEPKPTTSRIVLPSTTGEAPDPRNTFPGTVPNLPPLAAVPATDDTPRSGGRRPPTTVATPEPPTTDADPAEGAPVRATIIEFSRSGGGVRILINKGADAGVEAGWTGYVMDTDSKSKKSLKNGAFRIRAVRNDEAEGVTTLTLDQIQHNRTVWLKPPN